MGISAIKKSKTGRPQSQKVASVVPRSHLNNCTDQEAAIKPSTNIRYPSNIHAIGGRRKVLQWPPYWQRLWVTLMGNAYGKRSLPPLSKLPNRHQHSSGLA